MKQGNTKTHADTYGEHIRTQLAAGRTTQEAHAIATWASHEDALRASLPRPTCPAWCRLPRGHEWNDGPASIGDNGQPVFTREHDGPTWGPFQACGWEDSNALGSVFRSITVPDTKAFGNDIEDADEMRALADHAAQAAAWLEGTD